MAWISNLRLDGPWKILPYVLGATKCFSRTLIGYKSFLKISIFSSSHPSQILQTGPLNISGSLLQAKMVKASKENHSNKFLFAIRDPYSTANRKLEIFFLPSTLRCFKKKIDFFLSNTSNTSIVSCPVSSVIRFQRIRKWMRCNKILIV